MLKKKSINLLFLVLIFVSLNQCKQDKDNIANRDAGKNDSTTGTTTGTTDAFADSGVTAGTNTGSTASTAGTNTGATAGTNTGSTAGTNTGSTAGGTTGFGPDHMNQLRQRNAGETFYSYIAYSSPLNSHVSGGKECSENFRRLQPDLRTQDCGGNNCSGKNRWCIVGDQDRQWGNVNAKTNVVIDFVISPVHIKNPQVGPNDPRKCADYTLTYNGATITLEAIESMPIQLCRAGGNDGTGCDGVRQMCTYRTAAENVPLETEVLQKIVATPEMKFETANAEEFWKFNISAQAIKVLVDKRTANQITEQQLAQEIQTIAKPLCTNLAKSHNASTPPPYVPLKFGHPIIANCSHSNGNGVGCFGYRVICGIYDKT